MMRSMAVSHMGSLKIPTKKNQTSNATIKGKSQKKIYHTNLRQVWILPKKQMAIFHDPELHIPPFLKNIYIYIYIYISLPTWRRLKAFLNKTRTIQKLQSFMCSKSWLVLGNRTLWWHHQRKAFHLNMPHVETYPTRRLQITKRSARFNKGAHHLCFFTLHKLRTGLWSEIELSRIYLSTIIAMFVRIQKKYTSTKLSAGGMPVSFSGSDLGRLKSHQAFEVLNIKNDDLYIY